MTDLELLQQNTMRFKEILMLLDNLTNDEGLKKNAFDIDALVSELMEFSIYWFVEELENTDE